jgi:glycosyltransferase involved in cell wall biosynthesis
MLLMNALPLVSICVPTYNQVGFIAETLDSILAQDYPSIEVIVADDASSDGTQAIVSSYATTCPGRVIAVLNERNLGISGNVNSALRVARGEFLAWLGGDDVMLPGRLSKQVRLMQSHPEAVGCTHDAEVFDSSTNRVLGRFSIWMNGFDGGLSGDVSLWFRSDYSMLPSTFMYRRRFVPRSGYDTRLKYASDWLFDVQTFVHGRVVGTDEVLTRYRRHGGNVTGSAQLRETALEDNLIALGVVEARLPALAGLVRRRRATLLMGAARRKWMEGSHAESRQLLRSAFTLSGVSCCAREVALWSVSRYLLGRRPTRIAE